MILITGTTGLVGQHLLKELAQKDQPIRALYRTEEKRIQTIKRLAPLLEQRHRKNLNFVNWFKADINDIPQLTKAFNKVTEVYHCAGLVSFDITDKDKLRKINIEGTANMVNLALQAQVHKFCHLSSVATLGREPTNQRSINEASPRDNTKSYNYYEISKYGGEMEVWRASQEGLPVVIVNPAIIIGAGHWASGSGQLFNRVAKGLFFRIPKESGFISVQDVVQAMILLMHSTITNERFLLASETKSIAAVTDQIAHYLKQKPPKIPLKKWMVGVLWIVQSISHTLFRTPQQLTSESLKTIFGTVQFDDSKIQKSINIEFTPIDQAIQETALQFRKEHTD